MSVSEKTIEIDPNSAESVELDGKTIPLPPGWKLKITNHPDVKFKNRHSRKMARQDYDTERKRILLHEIGDSVEKRKAYCYDKKVKFRKFIIILSFIMFISWVTPELLPVFLNFFSKYIGG